MTANSMKIDLSNIEDLLKLLLEISAWAEDLQNNMERLREDLDEFIASSGSDSSGGDDDSCEDNSCDDSDEEDKSSGDESDEDDSRCEVTVTNKDPVIQWECKLGRSPPFS